MPICHSRSTSQYLDAVSTTDTPIPYDKFGEELSRTRKLDCTRPICVINAKKFRLSCKGESPEVKSGYLTQCKVVRPIAAFTYLRRSYDPQGGVDPVSRQILTAELRNGVRLCDMRMGAGSTQSCSRLCRPFSRAMLLRPLCRAPADL